MKKVYLNFLNKKVNYRKFAIDRPGGVHFFDAHLF